MTRRKKNKREIVVDIGVKALNGRILTQKEVDNLKEGTDVIIYWSGGNGPNRYKIHKRENEKGSFVKPHNPNCGWYDGEITFVGKEKYNTKVILF